MEPGARVCLPREGLKGRKLGGVAGGCKPGGPEEGGVQR